MLKPIPAKILKTTATVKVCSGVDRYQKQTYTDHTIKRVHIQPSNEVRKTPQNTDCTLRAILFADARRSTPFDWWENFTAAHNIAGDVRVVADGVEYTVETVEALMDDTDRLHHWEIGLV